MRLSDGDARGECRSVPVFFMGGETIIRGIRDVVSSHAGEGKHLEWGKLKRDGVCERVLGAG